MTFSVPTRQTAHLTLEERDELERAVDGPITAQHAKDMLAARSRVGVPTIASLTACLKEAQEHLTWLRSRKAATGSTAFDQAIACQVTRIDELDAKLAALSANPLQIAAE